MQCEMTEGKQGQGESGQLMCGEGQPAKGSRVVKHSESIVSGVGERRGALTGRGREWAVKGTERRGRDS